MMHLKKKAESGYAYYHLPHSDSYVYLFQESRPEELVVHGITEEQEGFLIVPFVVDAKSSPVFIRPDHVEECLLESENKLDFSHYLTDEETRKEHYSTSFSKFMKELRTKSVEKVVLSRRLQLTRTGGDPWSSRDFFLRACRYYPNHYVALWSTPQTGTWLVATPEVLVEKVAGIWKTMSLAGTMTWEAGKLEGRHAYWSPKDRKEQRIVTEYVYNCLLPYSEQIELRGPYPVKAGELAHLKTDLLFSLRPSILLGDLLGTLHPTPAVCGLPKEESLKLILDGEDSSRRYYSGFSGPLKIKGETRFYVSLRCMEFSEDTALLYAGGGLLRDSEEDFEWIETCRKMETMLSLFSSLESL